MIQYSYKHILRVQVIARFWFTYIAHNQTKSEYAYTTGTPGEPLSTVNYAYGNSDWKDLLTEYNGTVINYDLSGNPLNWRNASALTWNGRRLAGMTLTNGTELAFEYNSDGLRTSKTAGNSTVQYVWNDGNLVAEIRDGYTLKFLYNNGEAAGFSYNGADYYYGKDSFGVIRYLYNTSGEVVTTYTYDAWGTVLSVTGTLAETVGTVNPVRYKSYYLDSETGWYYLQSRYYDPAVGRFLNADDVLVVFEDERNIIVYCNNNPIRLVDAKGDKAKDGNMGIVGERSLPSGNYIQKTIKNASKVTWAITYDYKHIAKNHCGAVAVANLALYFCASGYSNLMARARRQGSVYETFVKVHKIVGNGPSIVVARKAQKYFRSRGYSLKYSGANSASAVKNAIDKERPVGILIADGVFGWHWIVCIGYRKYSNGDFYMQIVDGWNDTSKKYYRPFVGSAWISGTQYWI